MEPITQQFYADKTEEYKEIQRKVRIGVQDFISELNRVNPSLVDQYLDLLVDQSYLISYNSSDK